MPSHELWLKTSQSEPWSVQAWLLTMNALLLFCSFRLLTLEEFKLLEDENAGVVRKQMLAEGTEKRRRLFCCSEPRSWGFDGHWELFGDFGLCSFEM